ncbi:MAG TPA: amino acid permease, partial [Dermatophilaceae bacterium]|nr:amino acid permease [Dermatophilaceae bacterium]
MTQGHRSEPSLVRRIGPGLLLLFIVGDILGTGVYALTGKVANEVGGAVWLPFLFAFIVALLTACSYLELVTKYPRAGGAAVFTHKAFHIHFITFLVAFTVMSSGLTSASSASKAFAGNLAQAAGWDAKSGSVVLLVTALAFMTLIAIVNFRGVSE